MRLCLAILIDNAAIIACWKSGLVLKSENAFGRILHTIGCAYILKFV